MKDVTSELLARVLPFWGVLTEDEQRLVAQYAYIAKYDEGALIHSGEKRCRGLTAVLEGEISVYISSVEGRELTIERLFPVETCVLTLSCIMEELTFDVSVSAEADSRILVVPAQTMKMLMDKNIRASNFLRRMVMLSYSRTVESVERMLFQELPVRIMTFLIGEAERIGSSEIFITHAQLARYTGSAREAVSRCLKKLQKDGKITYSRGKITLQSK